MKHIKYLSLTLTIALALSGMSFATSSTDTAPAQATANSPMTTSAPAKVAEKDTLLVGKVTTNSHEINTLKIGKTLQVIIPENATTGYTWQITVSGTKSAISYTFEKADPKAAPTMPGQGMDKRLVVKGLKKGTATIKMSLIRPWEKKVEPIEIREYVVKVQ